MASVDSPGGERGIGDELTARVAAYQAELVALRREIHAHPELGRAEWRTTQLISARLLAAGLSPEALPDTPGLTCDIGVGPRSVGLRADIDALPLQDLKAVAWRSTVPDVCHACGHDVHIATVLGAGLVLADLHREGRLAGRVRLVFQPAEELMPGGALDVIASGRVDDIDEIFTLHCDPRLGVGDVAFRPGAITAACDRVTVRLTGPGGHTARPHLTADLVHALGTVVTELPAALSRRVDPRAGLSLVWGRINAGSAANAIPTSGEVEGTVRCLDSAVWHSARTIVSSLVDAVVAPYAVTAEVDYRPGVPPVDNDPDCTALFAAAGRAVLGSEHVGAAEQSLGGEDFAWYTQRIPGSLARLGTARIAASGEPEGHPVLDAHDLHQGAFDPDEAAIGVGARLLAAAAMMATRSVPPASS